MYTELRIIYFSDTYSFPDLTIEQREFGILSDVVRSGVKRSYKKYVGRARRSIGNKLKDSINKDLKDKRSAVNSFRNRDIVFDENVERKLIKESKNKYNSRTLGFPLGGDKSKNLVLKSKDIPKDLKVSDFPEDQIRVASKMINSSKKNNYIIFHPSKSGTDSLAHEIGHIQNENKGLFNRSISKLSSSIKMDQKPLNDIKNDKGFRKGLGNLIKGKIRIQEEKNASKNAIRLLKNSGMKENDINKSRRNLDTALNTYIHDSNIRYKVPLMNRIQIPSRRGKI